MKKNNNNIMENNSLGLNIELNNDTIVIKGSKLDLVELANYIVNVAVSNNNSDHLHLDELSLISNESQIRNLIIEKECYQKNVDR